MGNIRKNHTPTFKAKVSLDALQGKQTLEELSSRYQVSSRQVVRWKKEVIDNLPNIFNDKHSKQLKEKDLIISDLYEQLGKLKMEYEWLKKKIDSIYE